jgi:cytochrome P450
VDGVRLTDDEVMLNCYSLILGGDETTRLAMVGAVQALIEHPEQWRALKDGSISTASATEEILRWTAPAMHVGRTATEDVDLHGHRIRAGDIVTGWVISANFDETVFANPRTFDLARAPNRHLTFSYGPHFCLGVHLARLEIRALLEALCSTVDRIEAAGTPRPIFSNFLRGFSSLPVRMYG